MGGSSVHVQLIFGVKSMSQYGVRSTPKYSVLLVQKRWVSWHISKSSRRCSLFVGRVGPFFFCGFPVNQGPRPWGVGLFHAKSA